MTCYWFEDGHYHFIKDTKEFSKDFNINKAKVHTFLFLKIFFHTFYIK